MNNMGFVEIQTPIFTNSSPEGARDYLIPSRINKGQFYALPQSPQQLKQLLMVSGFDRYFQIAPCFRDEDPRADRLPCEFYQLDFEMSYAEQEDVLQVLEKVMYNTFVKNVKEGRIVDKPPFLRLRYKESLDKFGIDKPDLRNPLIMHNISKDIEDLNINIFENKNVIMQIVHNTSSRKLYDNLTSFVKDDLKGKGLAWIKIDDEGNISGSLSKAFEDKSEEKLNILKEFLKNQKEKHIKENEGRNEAKLEIYDDNYIIQNNTSIFFIADEDLEVAQKISGELRIKLR